MKAIFTTTVVLWAIALLVLISGIAKPSMDCMVSGPFCRTTDYTTFLWVVIGCLTAVLAAFTAGQALRK